MHNPNNFTRTGRPPVADDPVILLAHGGGGTLMHRLTAEVFYPAFANPILHQQGDGAILSMGAQRLAFTTDSYVVHPLFFPGGDIGTLAVNGTVNDLAMCGARPLYLSAAFILEEGLPVATLRRVVESMRLSAGKAHVQIVTGDTKVVEKGKGDGLFINTAGIGIIEHQRSIQPRRVKPGDVVLLSGDIGRHGLTIMAMRGGLAFESEITSDCAPLAEPVLALLEAGIQIHCLRDLTRGGLASGMVEIAATAGVQIHLEERAIPVRDDVRGACEILGFDPLHLANEGRFAVFLPDGDAGRAVDILKAHDCSRGAVRIGRVSDEHPGLVTMTTAIGTRRIVDMLSGEQLPRIC
ncbi:MAG: hydrogenase expression/formation protein HypE [Desulfobacterales bacterium]|nr:hydrogenase expression/formation protein HypE [Desulfobacterales bacterium]